MTTSGTYPRCGGKTRSGGRCTQAAGWGTAHPGEGKCKLHGGASPRGADSPHFKHGIYSDFMTASMQQKAAAMESTIDLISELLLLRTLLAEYLGRFQVLGLSPSGDDIEIIRALADTIRKTTDSIVKQRNSTALTAVEIALLIEKIPLLVMKYVQGTETQRAFIGELFDIIPAGREGFGEAGLASGVIAHPHRPE